MSALGCMTCGRQYPSIHAMHQCQTPDCPWIKAFPGNALQSEMTKLRVKTAELRELLEEALNRSQESGDLTASEIVWRIYTQAALGHYEPDEKPPAIVALVAAVMHWSRVRHIHGVHLTAKENAENDILVALAALDEDL